MQKRTFALAGLVTVLLIGAATATTVFTSRSTATQSVVVENVFDRPLHCDRLPDLDSIAPGQSNLIDDWREECALQTTVAER